MNDFLQWLRYSWSRYQSKRRDFKLWVEQGKPIDEPVVLKQGDVLVCPHEFHLVTNWEWSANFQQTPIRPDEMVRRYVERYDEEPVAWIEGCPQCKRHFTDGIPTWPAPVEGGKL